MSLNTPLLYIAGTHYAGTVTAGRPALNASITWGTDSPVDFAGPAVLTAEVLLKAGQSFSAGIGSTCAVLDDTGRTFFAGRLTGLTMRRHESIAGAQLVSITAADTLADLAGYRREKTQWTTALEGGWTAADRRGQLDFIKPAGWTLAGPTPYDWTEARQQRWNGAYWLDLLDMHLRSTLARRHTTTTYSPAGGLARRLTIGPERGKTGPNTGDAIIRLPASNIREDIEWEKNPDDRVTAVKLTSHGILFPDDGESESQPFDVWAEAYPGVSLGALQSSYGYHELALDIDSLGGGAGTTSPHIGQLVNYWIDTDTRWRPTALGIADTRRLSDATVRDLLDATKRGTAYAIVEDLPPGNASGFARVESYITGGTAAWRGKKWEIDLTLGRQTAAAGTPIGA